MIVIKHREEENERLEEEIDGYRDDIDKMLEAFKDREKELSLEIENIQERNNVLNNLLDLMTERAETTQRDFDRHLKGCTRSAGVGDISPLSDVSTGSDDVFSDTGVRIWKELK